jgi:MFS family permease
MFFFSQPFALSLGIRNVRGFFVAFTLAALFVRVFLGRVADFVGHGRVSLVALFSYAASIAAMVWLAAGRLEWIGAAFGLSQGFFLPAFTALVLGQAPPQQRGPMMVLFNAYFGAGSAAVLWIGVAAEQVGYRSVFVATGALVLLAPIALLRWPMLSVASGAMSPR